MIDKKIDNITIKYLKETKIYKKLSQKCKLSKLNKVEILNIIKDECYINNQPNELVQYNILMLPEDFDFTTAIEIGQGATAKIYLIKKKKNNKKYIFKKINKKRSEYAIQEMDILNKLSSNCKLYFLCYDGYTYDDLFIYLITNYIPDSINLSEYLRYNPNITILMKLFIIKQIVEGFFELHKNEVVHMDIKPDNILITSKLKIKIIDFGFSCINKNKFCYQKRKGSANHISPDVLNDNIVNFKIAKASDIWSIGILIYYIINDVYPWNKDLTRNQLLGIIKNLKKPIKSELLGNIINPMLVINPNKRYKNFPFVLDEINKEINNYK